MTARIKWDEDHIVIIQWDEDNGAVDVTVEYQGDKYTGSVYLTGGGDV